MSCNKRAGRCETMKAAASEPYDSQSEKTKARQEEEENPILTAWNRLQHSLSEDPADPGPPQSFLAKQRRFTQDRRRPRSTLQEPRYQACGEQKNGSPD